MRTEEQKFFVEMTKDEVDQYKILKDLKDISHPDMYAISWEGCFNKKVTEGVRLLNRDETINRLTGIIDDLRKANSNCHNERYKYLDQLIRIRRRFFGLIKIEY